MKLVRFLSLSLVICLLFSVNVFGVEMNSFKDVNVGDSYYDAVEYLVDKGVVKGCGNDLFNPDSNITLNHFAIMLVRAFGDVKYEDRPLPICHSYGWIDMFTVSQSPDSDISRGALYQSLFTVNNVGVFSADGKNVRWDDYGKAVESLVGFTNYDLGNGITRGEVAELFYYFMTNDVVIELPDVLKGIVFENDTQNIGSYVAAFEKVPTVVLDEFKELGWKINLTNTEFAKYQTETGVIANGLCDYTNKTISLKTPSSLVHEFGHFVDYICDYSLGIDTLFKVEGSVLEKYKGYEIDNSREYFAEYFDYYISAKTNNDRLVFLKESTPQTFEYFKLLEENNWNVDRI